MLMFNGIIELCAWIRDTLKCDNELVDLLIERFELDGALQIREDGAVFLWGINEDDLFMEAENVNA